MVDMLIIVQANIIITTATPPMITMIWMVIM